MLIKYANDGVDLKLKDKGVLINRAIALAVKALFLCNLSILYLEQQNV